MGAKGVQPRDIARKFPRAVQKALEETVIEMDHQFTEEIQTPKWGWPTITLRKNGSEANYVRDIVDLGNLMRSQQVQPINKYAWRWTWTAEYSAAVHDGANLKGGGVLLDRPWTKTAEDKVQPMGYFADILRRELDG